MLLAVAPVSVGGADEQDFYLAPHYDPRQDTQELVSAAMERAAAENKRVLLILGGDWCDWCEILDEAIDQSEKIVDLLSRHYIVAKVYCDSRMPSIRFKPRKQPRYGASFVTIRVKALPHLVVLDGDGERLLSRNLLGLAKKGEYSEEKLLRLLEKHK